jgi:hypothetical protein
MLFAGHDKKLRIANDLREEGVNDGRQIEVAL